MDNNGSTEDSNNEAAQAFIDRWNPSGGAERANYQSFLIELCDLIGVDHPEPAVDDGTLNSYVFEKAILFNNGDGTSSTKFADLYRRGSFICETKQGVERDELAELISTAQKKKASKRKKGHGKRGTKSYDATMQKAQGQAMAYARNLPAEEGRPPFLMVIDVGHTIELYSEFSQTGGAYVPFPDPLSHRIKLAELAKPEIRERLRLVWSDPLALDPARRSAKVTREIAARLAKLAISLEKDKHPAEEVAHFLMRCLFTMFAEDVDLIPKKSFQTMLESLDDPAHFAPVAADLWKTMNTGGFNAQLRANLKHFNGGLFADPSAIPINRDQLDLLIEAAKADWQDVEPAIFGTLLERALDPVERHKLGAHYTPRAYVERLIVPTVIEPLRQEWDAVRAAVITLVEDDKPKEASKELEVFHDRLCEIKVLDPACGSGNFLYVTLEHLKRLEGEVFNTFDQIAPGQRQVMLVSGHTVDPHQFLGIEINPRAAAIAELVLWIGYLQWHFRTLDNVDIPEPVIRRYNNIECRDAVLDFDSREEVLDAEGNVVTIWDGRTTKPHPVTGEEVPDDSARIPTYRYVNPRKAEWADADFVVGNPPFIGTAKMRSDLGDGYTESIRKTYKELPESCDFVMYWWHKAAELTRHGQLERFGFIATNSLRQTFNRRVLTPHLTGKPPLSLHYAVPDHPWVDTAFGAAVRISMTVGVAGESTGLLQKVLSETSESELGAEIEFADKRGSIHDNLTIGAAVGSALTLASNEELSNRGVTLMGTGFWVDPGDKLIRQYPEVVRPLRNGKDITTIPRNVYAIDFFGLEIEDARAKYPAAYQRVLEGVKPERDQSKRKSYRDKWWVFAEPRTELRKATYGLERYIVTSMTAKHRVFTFLDGHILADQGIIIISIQDAFALATLNSRIHMLWALAAGGRLGVGNDPRYNNSSCFETFPFPTPTDPQKTRIRELGEQLDAHRKTQQAAHPKLTMTGMYNVLEKLRSGEELSAKERTIHEQGLVSVLKQIHDDLDAAVADAYGWPVDLPDEEILERLVALNHERTAEEERGLIRWLRPEYQNPGGITQTDGLPDDVPDKKKAKKTAKAKIKKQPWPKSLSEQAAAVQVALATIAAPADEKEIAKRFTRANKERIAELLETLTSLGRARQLDDERYVAI